MSYLYDYVHGRVMIMFYVFVVNPQIEVLRARFSEITPASINRAIATLGPADARQNDAVEVRRELDLRIGMNHFLLVHRMYTITMHTRSLRLLCVLPG